MLRARKLLPLLTPWCGTNGLLIMNRANIAGIGTCFAKFWAIQITSNKTLQRIGAHKVEAGNWTISGKKESRTMQMVNVDPEMTLWPMRFDKV